MRFRPPSGTVPRAVSNVTSEPRHAHGRVVAGGVRRRATAAGERGATAVEFALVAPVLIALTLGIIEVGLLLFGASSAQSSVSSAARLGASQARVDGYQVQIADSLGASLRKVTAQPLQLSIFKADPTTGQPASGTTPAACTTDCYRFTWDTTTKAFVVTSGPTWPGASQRACGPADSTDFLGVWIQFRQESISGALPSRTYTASAVARLEPISTTTGSACTP